MKLIKSKISLILGVTIALSLSTMVEAMPKRKKIAFNFKAPTTSFSSFTIGGAVRAGSCAADTEGEKMSALLAHSTYTADSHPDFFVNIPQLDANKKATLIIQDESGDYYEMQEFQVPQEGGILKVSYDSNKPPLEADKNYQWSFNLHCQNNPRVDDPFVNGIVSRVNLEEALAKLETEDKINVLATSNIWYDTLAEAYELKEQGDDSYWLELQKSLVNR